MKFVRVKNVQTVPSDIAKDLALKGNHIEIPLVGQDIYEPVEPVDLINNVLGIIQRLGASPQTIAAIIIEVNRWEPVGEATPQEIVTK